MNIVPTRCNLFPSLMFKEHFDLVLHPFEPDGPDPKALVKHGKNNSTERVQTRGMGPQSLTP